MNRRRLFSLLPAAAIAPMLPLAKLSAAEAALRAASGASVSISGTLAVNALLPPPLPVGYMVSAAMSERVLRTVRETALPAEKQSS